jgi:hypothetical protein
VFENHKKTALMVKQKFKLLGTFEIGIPVTELAKDNGVGNKLLSIK